MNNADGHSLRPVTCAVAMGSNLGDRRAYLDAAVSGLAALPLSSVIAVSDMIETAPVGGPAQGAYLNAAAVLLTLLSPRDLLNRLLEIEQRHGRDRPNEQLWGPRTLDLDLLVYGDRVIQEPGLHVPHPRLHERGFVLEPLARIGPELIVPGLGKSIARLLLEFRDASGGGEVSRG